MSSALLKFQEASRDRLDLSIIAAAVEASPHALAITENENLAYQNRTFAQLISTAANQPRPTTPGSPWQMTEFTVGGRRFSLLTLRPENAEFEDTDLQHLAAIGRLVAGVAHDFNNLLTGILLYCDLLQSKANAAGALWKKTDEIRKAAEQGATLIRQLMTVGRKEPGERPAVSFNQVVLDLDSLLHHLLGERIQIVMELSDPSALVGITSAQAQQIVLNLALNARDAMPNGGTLRFVSRLRELEVSGPHQRVFEFVVSDTGHGMDEQTAAHAFDPFFSTKAAGRGTGLATVRGIVEAAGGLIHADSSSGHGTRMIVRLPEVPGETNSQARDLPRRSIPIQSNPMQSKDRGAAQ